MNKLILQKIKKDKIKPVQRKMFRLIRTANGFEYYKIGPGIRSQVISKQDMEYINKAIQENCDMAVGDSVQLLVEIYLEKPDICIDRKYIKLGKKETNSELN